jgi:molybdate transport system ATP-binding protein
MTLNVDIRRQLGALDLNIRLDAPRGVTAIFGRSGAGKTSLINVIAGLLHPDAGQITLNGRALTGPGLHVAAHKRRIGYVFQDARLFPHLNVRQNLTFGMRRAGPSAPGLDEVTALLGIEHLLHRAPRSLSGGEAQRVALGRALLSGPELLALDEPLAALDERRKQDILPYLEALRTGPLRCPVLYVSHSLDEIARVADQIALLENGKIIRQGPVFDVLSDPTALPNIGVRQAGAMIQATVADHGPDGITTLRTSAGTLELPGISAPPGAQIRLRVMAQDVILSLDRPVGLSSRNILPATVKAIHHGDGPGAAIVVQSGTDRLLARLTTRAVRDLALQPGQQVFAIFKATTIAPQRIGG